MSLFRFVIAPLAAIALLSGAAFANEDDDIFAPAYHTEPVAEACGEVHQVDLGGGEIAAHRHCNINPEDGTVTAGGWVAETAFVAETAIVDVGARVVDEARVEDYAQVLGESQVSGRAVVQGKARLQGRCHVYGDGVLKDEAVCSGRGRIYGRAEVSGEAVVAGSSRVHGSARVSASARLEAYARLMTGASASFTPALLNVPSLDVTVSDDFIVFTVSSGASEKAGAVRIGNWLEWDEQTWRSKFEEKGFDVAMTATVYEYRGVISALAELHKRHVRIASIAASPAAE